MIVLRPNTSVVCDFWHVWDSDSSHGFSHVVHVVLKNSIFPRLTRPGPTQDTEVQLSAVGIVYENIFIFRLAPQPVSRIPERIHRR